MWDLPDALADSKPAFVALMYHGRDTNACQTTQPSLDAYIAERVGLVRSGEATPIDLRRSNGKVIRFQCAVLPDGGRMLSYTTVTDIVRYSDELEALRNALDRLPDGIVLLDSDLKVRLLNKENANVLGCNGATSRRPPVICKADCRRAACGCPWRAAGTTRGVFRQPGRSGANRGA